MALTYDTCIFSCFTATFTYFKAQFVEADSIGSDFHKKGECDFIDKRGYLCTFCRLYTYAVAPNS